MKTLYLECNMGASGDMLMGALLQLLPKPEPFLQQMNTLFGQAGVRVSCAEAEQCGIKGVHVSVSVLGEAEESRDVHVHNHVHNQEHDQGHGHLHSHETETGHHRHTDLNTIRHFLSHLAVSQTVRLQAEQVYLAIAEAESHAHGNPVEEIHFHEVGAMDAVADITGVCLLMELLSPEQVVVSPVHMGSGHVHCAHGILPVPAPATAYLLQGIPSYGGSIQGELCTPTGAALLKTFATSFGSMPVMRTEKIGYGMGSKVFPMVNCVRAFWGTTEEEAAPSIVELKCNLDDMTPEAVGYAQERLWEAGAVEVFTVPVSMKKNRPGVLLTCLCRPEAEESVMRAMFRYTTTLGIRKTCCARYELDRYMETKDTTQGKVRIKHAQGYGVERAKPEYEDVADIAKAQEIAYFDVKI